MNWLEIELKWQDMTRRAQGTRLAQPQDAVLNRVGTDATKGGKTASGLHYDADSVIVSSNLKTS